MQDVDSRFPSLGLAVHDFTILWAGGAKTDLTDPYCHKRMALSIREFLSRKRSYKQKSKNSLGGIA